MTDLITKNNVGDKNVVRIFLKHEFLQAYMMGLGDLEEMHGVGCLFHIPDSNKNGYALAHYVVPTEKTDEFVHSAEKILDGTFYDDCRPEIRREFKQLMQPKI